MRNDWPRTPSICGGPICGSRLRDPIDPASFARLNELAARRSNGEPLAYVIGSTEFYCITIEVGPGVLARRPDRIDPLCTG
jgi:methylase of polypeptide subunit release factors